MITLRKDVDTVVGYGLAVLPRVNLLPPEIADQARFRKIQGGLGLGVLSAVLVVGAVYVGASSSVSAAQTRLDTASTEQSGLTRQAAGYRDVTEAYARAAASEQMLATALGSEVRYSRLLTDLAQAMPPGVWLSTASYTQQAPAASTATPSAATTGSGLAALSEIGTVSFSGIAMEHDDVAVWLESLAGQAGFADPYLQSATEELLGTKVVVNWSATVSLTGAALSGRYALNGG